MNSNHVHRGLLMKNRCPMKTWPMPHPIQRTMWSNWCRTTSMKTPNWNGMTGYVEDKQRIPMSKSQCRTLTSSTLSMSIGKANLFCHLKFGQDCVTWRYHIMYGNIISNQDLWRWWWYQKNTQSQFHCRLKRHIIVWYSRTRRKKLKESSLLPSSQINHCFINGSISSKVKQLFM